MSASVTLGEPELQRPTLAGYSEGVICMEPPTLQCRGCGATATGPRAGYLVILSGFHFHTCDGREGVRYCPTCLADIESACSRKVHA